MFCIWSMSWLWWTGVRHPWREKGRRFLGSVICGWDDEEKVRLKGSVLIKNSSHYTHPPSNSSKTLSLSWNITTDSSEGSLAGNVVATCGIWYFCDSHAGAWLKNNVLMIHGWGASIVFQGANINGPTWKWRGMYVAWPSISGVMLHWPSSVIKTN